jgi:hypothetical protein
MPQDLRSTRERLFALYVSRTALIGALVLACVFLLVRVASPMLMDMRDTALFVLGAACWPLATLILFWAGVWFASDWRTFRRRLSSLHLEKITHE